jgi:DnaJ-class molecular chaperone
MTITMIMEHDDDRELPFCDSCKGSGSIDIGDPEDGVTDVCFVCDGTGKQLQGDEFIPERDAFTPND